MVAERVCGFDGADEGAGFEVVAPPELVSASSSTSCTSSPNRLSAPRCLGLLRKKPKKRPTNLVVFVVAMSVGIVLIVAVVLLATLLPADAGQSAAAAPEGGSAMHAASSMTNNSSTATDQAGDSSEATVVNEASREHEEEQTEQETSAETSSAAAAASAAAAPPRRWNSMQDLQFLTFLVDEQDANNTERTCDWLREQLMLDFDATIGTYCHPPMGQRLPLSAVICPATCLRVAPTVCEDSTALVPVPVPLPVPSSSSLVGEESRTHEESQEEEAVSQSQALSLQEPRDCSWFGEDAARISEYCSSSSSSSSSSDWSGITTRADAACPRTCGKCPTDASTTVEADGSITSSAPIICPSIPYASHDEDDVLTFRRSFGSVRSHESSSGGNKPDRYFRIYTPENFDPTQPNKVVFMYHGWTTGTYCRGRNFLSSEWRDVADEHGYVLIAVDGLAENDSDAPRSFTFPGSADGIGRDGESTTTCKTQQSGPDYCYPSCQRQGRCNNRCGWTHCLDEDDIQFFVDLVDEVANKYVCIDRSRVYVYGYSMGGMFTWSLAQDPRSSPLIAGIGTIMGLPLHDYLLGKGDSSNNIPAIGIYGDGDCIVPPGDGTNVYNEGCDGDAYRYVDAFHQHKLWAEEHGCAVGDTHPARYVYNIDGRNEVECATHCNPATGPPMSVDCRNDAEHGKEPWHLDVVLKFFEDHWQANK